ncbi:alpha-L-arabinofuranosidase C-terminal domain-containing protein [Paludibacter sp.]
MSFSLITKAQQNYQFQLDVKKLGAPIQSTMYGLFFEDINFGADGGLYAELVKNRSFDFPQNLMGWNAYGNVEVIKENPLFPNNPNYLKLRGTSHNDKYTGIENEGFRGIGFKEKEIYRFSVWAKKEIGYSNQKLRVQLINSRNDIIASKDFDITEEKWKQYEIELSPKETDAKGSLRIYLQSTGVVYVEHVSLFPTDTWKGRKGGLRKDLAQALADIKPGVFRFPGGCIVEGTDLETRYDWKKSVGSVENRPLNENRWHYTFQHRFFPDYFQSYGLGFYEYFLIAEDIGAEPLPVVNVGLACQFQNKCCDAHQPLAELDSYVQDALDLIEFANGDINSKWGKLRAEMGHPEPFNMKFIGVGNEQWGQEYVERLAVFTKAIRAQYPNIKIVGSSGPFAEGDKFEYLWPEMKKLKVDLVDEHYYKDPQWFLNSATRYDNYDRKGPAVFAGEYACHDHSSGNQNNFRSALYEAAFMTGLERNADIVHMCTYAPLFAHVDAWQWHPDMIWFDNLNMVKTPNYYVQHLYGHNVGTNIASLTIDNKPITGQDGLYASAVFDKKLNGYIIKIVNTDNQSKEIQINLQNKNKKQVFELGECVSLQNDNLNSINTIKNTDVILPKTTSAQFDGNTIKIKAEKLSFNVYKVIVK